MALVSDRLATPATRRDNHGDLNLRLVGFDGVSTRSKLQHGDFGTRGPGKVTISPWTPIAPLVYRGVVTAKMLKPLFEPGCHQHIPTTAVMSLPSSSSARHMNRYWGSWIGVGYQGLTRIAPRRRPATMVPRILAIRPEAKIVRPAEKRRTTSTAPRHLIQSPPGKPTSTCSTAFRRGRREGARESS